MWRGYGGGASRRVGRPGVGWGWMEGGVWDVGEVRGEIYGREGVKGRRRRARGGGGAAAAAGGGGAGDSRADVAARHSTCIYAW